MKLRPGEQMIDILDLIEDTKGNSGDKGKKWSALANKKSSKDIIT